MPPIEVGPARAISAIESWLARQAGTEGHGPVKARPQPEKAVVKSDALDPGQPPVDTDRVKLIREAIESGKYPIVPARIADAMIAAGYLLRSGN